MPGARDAGWSRPVMPQAPQAPPPRNPSQPRRPANGRRAADRGCASSSCSNGRAVQAECRRHHDLLSCGGGPGSPTTRRPSEGALAPGNIAGLSGSAGARAPSEPVPRASAAAGGQAMAAVAATEEGSRTRAISVDACGSEAAALAKARAVASLQKLFFEELSRGQDANGAAARALLRLTEQPTEPPTEPTANPVGAVISNTVPTAEAKFQEHGKNLTEALSGRPPSPVAPAAIEESVGLQRNNMFPHAPRAPPLAAAPGRRRPAPPVRPRVAVQN